MIRSYMRNKYASTTNLDDGSLLVHTRVEDTFFAATLEMVVTAPLLEIVSVQGEILRSFNDECREMASLLQKAVGLHIGTGFLKTVKGLVGGPEGCPRMEDLILEACDEVILRFTVDPLRQFLSSDIEELIKGNQAMIRGNPRLLGSCVAFSEGSPLVKGIEA